MQMFRQRKYLFAVAALVLVFAGCKGESPTAPTTNPPTTTVGGGTPPPATATITLAVSNPTPQVNSSSIITATVTDANNQPVPNGTAVEFDTTLGTFTEANAQTVIRTTTNGVATVTLTSALAGPATVSAIVANVKKTATVTFSTIPITPPPPDTTPVITGISPTFGAPQGGQVVTITGKNFRIPLRVLFDFGPGKTPKDATIITSTSTSIQVLTPSVDLGASAQQLTATIKVINEAGTPNEIVVTGPTFTYQLTVLTPKITTVSPASGPIDGGTRVVIYGEGFQSPVQVFFGAAEVQPIQVLFNQITVVTPPARDATPDASGTGTGAVDVRVINIGSATQVTLPLAFRFIPKMAITALGPGTGTAFGGTIVTIDGTGFNDPVTVSFDGLVAQVLKVSGSQIIARTSRTPIPCAPPTAPTIVTNIDNGDSANGPTFAYNPEKPLIVGVTPSDVTAGESTTVTVVKPGVGIDGTAFIRFTLGTATGLPSPAEITDPVGPTAFVVTTPQQSSLSFPKVACTVGGLAGTKNGPITVDVVFTNVTTGCTDTLKSGLILEPSDTSCTATATPPVATVSPSNLCSPQPGAWTNVTVGNQANVLITVSNGGSSNASALTFNATVSGTNGGDFTVSPTSGSVSASGGPVPVSVTFKPTATGTRTATLTFTTNDPNKPTITVCLQGTGAP